MSKLDDPLQFTFHPEFRHSLKLPKNNRRILVYCHDTYGLGNIRRMLSICADLVDNDPNLSVLLISGSPRIYGFEIPRRVEHIKLPELTRTKNNGYSSKSLPEELDLVIKLRSELIYTAAINFNPDVLLVDKKPQGVENELELTINYFCENRPKTRLVLLLRDILDTPEITERIWDRNRYHDVIGRCFDQVLVAGTPEVFDLCKEYHFPATTVNKVHCCGYIQRMPLIKRCRMKKKSPTCDDEKRILVTVGGGQDGYRVLHTYLRGLELLPARHNTRSLIVTGPSLSEDWKGELFQMAAAFPFVDIIEFTDNIVHEMNEADLIISMGGYNTICEILSLKKSAIVIPRVTPVKEQLIRAERMAKLGLFRTIHPDRLTPNGLIKVVLEEIWLENGNKKSGYAISLEGLHQIREKIYNQRSGTDKRDTAQSSPIEYAILQKSSLERKR